MVEHQDLPLRIGKIPEGLRDGLAGFESGVDGGLLGRNARRGDPRLAVNPKAMPPATLVCPALSGGDPEEPAAEAALLFVARKGVEKREEDGLTDVVGGGGIGRGIESECEASDICTVANVEGSQRVGSTGPEAGHKLGIGVVRSGTHIGHVASLYGSVARIFGGADRRVEALPTGASPGVFDRELDEATVVPDAALLVDDIPDG